jgi:hypothetical protein
MNKLQYPVAKSNRLIHVAPQFRPIKRGARRKGIEREYYYKSGAKLTINIFKECDIADQSLLYAIIGMCLSREKGKILSKEPISDAGKELRKKLEIRGDIIELDSLVIKTNKYELNKELGKCKSGKSLNWIIASLKRLKGISFDYEDDKSAWGFNLLSYYVDKETGDIKISINPLSALVILQNKGYVHIHREERQELDSDIAKALLSVLAGMVDPGRERILKADMLADKVYARYDENISEETKRMRRGQIKSAAKEINGLDGWDVNIFGRGGKLAIRAKRKRISKKNR